MHIDVLLDVVCPWCFIGKRRLDTALAMRPGLVAEIAWRPFQLNPDLPVDGLARRDYLAAKFGGGSHASRIHQTVAETGAQVGIRFAFDRIERTPNTRDAHRLVRFAAARGLASAIVEALFQAYFLAGRDLGSQSVLADIAGQAGLPREEVRRFLASEESLAEVIAEDRNARRAGINAVPCFIFEGQYAISGAQEPEFFLPVFDLVRSEAVAGLA